MARFFYISNGVDYKELLEFLYRTYPNALHILAMPWMQGIEILQKGKEQQQKSELWLLYCSMYPHMNNDNFITFDDWFHSLKDEKNTPVSKIEIMDNVNNIINMTMKEA